MEGADQGIKYYLTPQWDKLFERKVRCPYFPIFSLFVGYFVLFWSLFLLDWTLEVLHCQDEVALIRDIVQKG